jgi:hypothetical protein
MQMGQIVQPGNAATLVERIKLSKQLCNEGCDTKHQVDAPAWPTSTAGPAFIVHCSHHLKSQHWFEVLAAKLPRLS